MAKRARKLSILLVEDDKIVTDLIISILNKSNFQIVCAPSVEASMVGFDGDNYDAVIMDIFMQGAGGIAGIQEIRKSAPDMPILAISAGFGGASPDAPLRAAQKIGANMALAKPFSADGLLDALKTIMA